MKSRRIKKQSVALQKCKKQLSRRRKSIRRGGGPKKSAKASEKATQRHNIDDVIEEIKTLIVVANAVPPRDDEISTIVNHIINSVGDVQTRKDGIDAILVNFTPYLNPTQKTALNAKKAELEAELTKKSQNESKLLSEQRAREAETQRKIVEREAEKKIREAEEKRAAEEVERKRVAEEAKKKAVKEAEEAKKKAVKEAEEAKKKAEEEAKTKKSLIKIISNKPIPPPAPISDMAIIPPPPPISIPPPSPISIPPLAPISDMAIIPPSAPISDVKTILQLIPQNIREAWINTGIFTESELLQLQSKFTNNSFKSYEQVISIFPSYSIKELFRFLNKDVTKSNPTAIHEYYDFVTRILLFVGILTEHIEKNPNLNFQIVIKGGIAAQILLSEKSKGNVKYKTADIDLLLLPKSNIPYVEKKDKKEEKEEKEKLLLKLQRQLQTHAENISDLIYFILDSPNTISILKPLESKGNKNIVKLSYNSNPDDPIFVAMMDIDFKIVPKGVYQYYADSNLQTYPTKYGYYKTQNYDAFIKEKLFYKSNLTILANYIDNKKELDENKMLINKFDASSQALLRLLNVNEQNNYNILYEHYNNTMKSYFTDPTKFEKGEYGFRPSNIPNHSIPDPPLPPPPKNNTNSNQNLLPPQPNIESYL